MSTSWFDPNTAYRIVATDRAAKKTAAMYLGVDVSASTPASPQPAPKPNSNQPSSVWTAQTTSAVTMLPAATTEAQTGPPASQLWFFRLVDPANPQTFYIFNMAKGVDYCLEHPPATVQSQDDVTWAKVDASRKDLQSWYISSTMLANGRLGPPTVTGAIKAAYIVPGPFDDEDLQTMPGRTNSKLETGKKNPGYVAVIKRGATGVEAPPFEDQKWDVQLVRAIVWKTKSVTIQVQVAT